jgi:hypothetical protein
MNKQEIFDTVAKHLFKQGKRAWRDTKGCEYRSEDGSMCAVGCLIPDDLYHPSMEGYPVQDIAESVEFLGSENLELLAELQLTHDMVFHWKSELTMKAELASVAKKHEINPSILDNLHFNKKEEA